MLWDLGVSDQIEVHVCVCECDHTSAKVFSLLVQWGVAKLCVEKLQVDLTKL